MRDSGEQKGEIVKVLEETLGNLVHDLDWIDGLIGDSICENISNRII